MDGEELGKTRAQTKAEKNGEAEPVALEENGKHENGQEDGGETNANEEDTDDDKAALKRTRTMEETVKVCC